MSCLKDSNDWVFHVIFTLDCDVQCSFLEHAFSSGKIEWRASIFVVKHLMKNWRISNSRYPPCRSTWAYRRYEIGWDGCEWIDTDVSVKVMSGNRIQELWRLVSLFSVGSGDDYEFRELSVEIGRIQLSRCMEDVYVAISWLKRSIVVSDWYWNFLYLLHIGISMSVSSASCVRRVIVLTLYSSSMTKSKYFKNQFTLLALMSQQHFKLTSYNCHAFRCHLDERNLKRRFFFTIRTAAFKFCLDIYFSQRILSSGQ